MKKNIILRPIYETTFFFKYKNSENENEYLKQNIEYINALKPKPMKGQLNILSTLEALKEFLKHCDAKYNIYRNKTKVILTGSFTSYEGYFKKFTFMIKTL